MPLICHDVLILKSTIISSLSADKMPHPICKSRELVRIGRGHSFWSEWRGSNSRPRGPKPMSKPSGSPVAPSLALSDTPAVPLWNSFALFASDTAFGFWDLCGIEFCILKVLPTGFTSNSGCFCRREQLRNCAA